MHDRQRERARDLTPQELLSAYPGPVRSAAEGLRVLVKQVAPGASETVQPGWKAISYAYGRTFCSIMPMSDGVNLAFPEGAELPDPHGLLVGTGKRMRHVRVTVGEEISSPELTALIRAAAERAE